MASNAISPNVDNRLRRDLGLPEHDAPAHLRLTSGAIPQASQTYYKDKRNKNVEEE
jgi:hypothetical protein